MTPTPESSHTPYSTPYSIVIPCRNEAGRLPETIRQLLSLLNTINSTPPEIILSIEPSSDHTLEIARAAHNAHPAITTLKLEEARGKGYNVRQGILHAKAPIIFFMDCDLSVPLFTIPKFLQTFDQHPEIQILIGNRQHPESIVKPQAFYRQIGGKALIGLIRLFGLTPYLDTQCGFKAFRKNAAHTLFSQSEIDGFSFDVEILLLAKYLGYPILEMPVKWTNNPESKVRPVRDGLQFLIDCFKLSKRIKKKLSARS